ncbi:hypothetical protein [Xanthobacter autotrophicus]|uniref:hypothetical protein n=1 Tax=Xanthobacter autotrophicus TaxID=280 RepID=UPI00372CCCCC
MNDTTEKPNAEAAGTRSGALDGMDMVPLPDDGYSPSALYDKLEAATFGCGFIGSAGSAALRAAGVPADVLRSGLISEARASFFPARRWDFAMGGGLPVLTVAVLDRFGEEIDTIAWPVTRPDKWARLTGKAIMLGEPALDVAHTEPVPAFRTPLSWLAGGAVGICILDATFMWKKLRSGPPISGEDLEHAKEIQAALSPPEPPRVYVRKHTSRRAA